MSNALYPNVRGLWLPVMKTAEDSTIVQRAPNFIETRIAQSQNPIWHFTLLYNYLKDNPLDVLSQYAPNTDYRILQGFFLARYAQGDDFLFDDVHDDAVGPALLTSASPYTGWQPSKIYILGAVIVVSGFFWSVTAISGGTQVGYSGTASPAFSGSSASDNVLTWTKGSAASGNQPNPNAQLQVVTDGTTYYSPIQRCFGGQFLEDITDLNQSVTPIAVYANGSLQTLGTNYSVSTTTGLAVPGASFMGQYLTWLTGAPTAPVTVALNFYFRLRFAMDKQDFERFLDQVWTIGGPEGKNGSGTLELVTSRGPAL